MNKVVKILMERDGMAKEDAVALVRETRNEILSNPEEMEEIIADNLGLEPDYLDYIL